MQTDKQRRQRLKRGIEYRKPSLVGDRIVTVTPGRGKRCTVTIEPAPQQTPIDKPRRG